VKPGRTARLRTLSMSFMMKNDNTNAKICDDKIEYTRELTLSSDIETDNLDHK